MINKFKEKKGFTLTEVLIGMMILTTAIVTLTTIVINLMQTNKSIVDSQKAFYFAQEGIEAVINIRDTNWLNNVDFKGRFDLLGVFLTNQKYSIGLSSFAWKNSNKNIVQDLRMYRTWDLVQFTEENSQICKYQSDNRYYFSLCGQSGSEKTGFRRYIEILPYCDDKEECDDMILVNSVVEYGDNFKNSFKLEFLLTNWKNGAL